jgi:hypothetical protein
MIKPEFYEQALYLRLLRPAQKNLSRRPMAAQGGLAIDPIGKQCKRQRVGIRIIVRLDDPIIGRQEESWSRRAGRKEQSRLALRKRVAIGAFDPLPGKGNKTLMQRSKAEIFGQGHFHSPAEPRLPAGLAQKIRDRGEAIEGIVPNIGRARAHVTDRIVEKGRGQELRAAHGTRPGSFHRRPGYAALAEHDKRADQFVAENRPVLPEVSQGRERANDVPLALCFSEIRLHAVGRKDNRGRHPEALFDLQKFAAPRMQTFPAARYASDGHSLANIGFERLIDYRLGI